MRLGVDNFYIQERIRSLSTLPRSKTRKTAVRNARSLLATCNLVRRTSASGAHQTRHFEGIFFLDVLLFLLLSSSSRTSHSPSTHIVMLTIIPSHHFILILLRCQLGMDALLVRHCYWRWNLFVRRSSTATAAGKYFP